MKRFSLLRFGALTAAVVCLLPPPTLADEYDKKTIITFDQPTEVPGIVLQPGKYVIKLLNSASNRHIAEIMNERMDHLYSLSFTAGAERLDINRTGKTVLTFYEGKNGQPRAVRVWFWPGDTNGQEFLYPKDQAAKIAANTGEKVAEGGLPTVAESGQSLTPDSAKATTLQSSDQSKPATTPFAARAAQPPAPAPLRAPAPVTVAQNTPPPAQSTQAADTSQSTSPAAASNSNSSSDTTLPQTASYLPIFGAIGIVSLAGALLIASARRSRAL